MPDPASDGSPLPAVFDRLAQLMRRRYGLSFGPDKIALAASRLGRLASEQGLSLPDYLRRRLAAPGDDYGDLVDRLTTSYTSFFRGEAQWRFIRETVLPDYAGRRGFTACSAGCASGEEPYSLLILLAEERGWESLAQTRVVALDVSRPALERARRGIYPARELAAFPADRLQRYFLRGRGRSEGYFRVRPELRRLVEFVRVNLVDPLPPTPWFDLILCANVMIYFDSATRGGVGRRLAERLRPGGYLAIGPAESFPGGALDLEPVGPSAYRRPARP